MSSGIDQEAEAGRSIGNIRGDLGVGQQHLSPLMTAWPGSFPTWSKVGCSSWLCLQSGHDTSKDQASGEVVSEIKGGVGAMANGSG